MIQILQDPILEISSYHAKLASPYVIKIDGKIIVIKELETDFATYPKLGFLTPLFRWLVWSVVPPISPWIHAIIVHDYFYDKIPSRKADELMRGIAITCGVSPIKAWFVYGFLRFFDVVRKFF